MSVNVNDKSGLVESFTPGYEGCGCGNRRYYTKAEIDEMFQNVLDPEQIEKIVKEVVDEYVTSEEFSQVIISIIGEDYYTKAQIDTILEGYATKAWTTGDTDSRISTAMASETARTEDVYAKKTDVPSLDGYATTGWVDSQNYLKDITLTINGTELHNNGSIIIEGGGGEPVDISGKLDTTAFTQAMQSETARTENVYAKKTDLDGKVDTSAFTAYTATTNECCDYVKGEIDDIWAIIATLTGDTPTPPGPEPPTPTPSQYVGEYLTIEALDSGEFTVHTPGAEYRVDDGPWSEVTEDLGLYLITGEKVQFRGYCSNTSGAEMFSGNTLAFKVYGNLMSLEYYDDFSGATQICESGEYVWMFKDATGLIDASNLVLPTGLTLSCFKGMFSGCTHMTVGPELPATVLVQGCYESMFEGCTSLTNAPELPATVLVHSCYMGMFSGCTSLSYVKCLATDISANACTAYWLYNVSVSGTFVKAASMSGWTRDIYGIPSGWTVVDNN